MLHAFRLSGDFDLSIKSCKARARSRRVRRISSVVTGYGDTEGVTSFFFLERYLVVVAAQFKNLGDTMHIQGYPKWQFSETRIQLAIKRGDVHIMIQVDFDIGLNRQLEI
jgi:hypothetical protein